MEQLGFFTVADGVPAVLAAIREQLKKGASQIKLAAGVPRSTLSTWPSSHSTRSKPRLIEDGPRGEVEFGSAEQPRGHEQRRVADAEAADDQRLEQGR
jgi:hypothetical protein